MEKTCSRYGLVSVRQRQAYRVDEQRCLVDEDASSSAGVLKRVTQAAMSVSAVWEDLGLRSDSPARSQPLSPGGSIFVGSCRRLETFARGSGPSM